MRGVRLVRAFRLLLLVGCVVAGVAASAAADPRVERQAQGIFHRIMSPYCPGLLLASCPSSLAEDLRNDIRAELEAGKAAVAIEDDLHRRFGDATRAAPAFKGIGMVAWIVPLLLFIVSSVALLAWLRRCRGEAAGSASASTFSASSTTAASQASVASSPVAPSASPSVSAAASASSGASFAYSSSHSHSHSYPASAQDSVPPRHSSSRAADVALNDRLDDELAAM